MSRQPLRNRMLNFKMFSDYKTICMPPEVKLCLLGLCCAADPDGEVTSDPKWLQSHVGILVGQTQEDISRWIKELVENEQLAPVPNLPLLKITEWDVPYGLTRQKLDKANRAGWRWRDLISENEDDDGQDLPRVRRVERQTSVREGEDEDRGEADLPRRRRPRGAKGRTESVPEPRSKPGAKSKLLRRVKKAPATVIEPREGVDLYLTEDDEDYEPQNGFGLPRDVIRERAARLLKPHRLTDEEVEFKQRLNKSMNRKVQ